MELFFTIVQSTVAAGIWYLGGLLWLRIIYPDVRDTLATIFLPPLFTGALIVVAVFIFDRLNMPIAKPSVWSVLLLNLLIPVAIMLIPRIRRRRSSPPAA